MLNGRLELHQPGCTGVSCKPDECVLDVEALCRSIAKAHSYGGVRKGGHLQPTRRLSDTELDDLLAHLIAAAWRASQSFSGGGRLAGWIVFKTHFAVTDFKRSEFGSTRYRPRPEIVAFDEVAHDGAVHFDDPTPGFASDEIDTAAMSPRTRFYYEFLAAMVAGDETATAYAKRLGLPASRVHMAARVIREELELQGLAPMARG